jgi:hypothetical protein
MDHPVSKCSFFGFRSNYMVSQASLANAIRVLAMDSIQAANSGHPGAPMGMAEMAVALWNRHLRHNPADPKWATATVSCSPTATARCCSTRCCT